MPLAGQTLFRRIVVSALLAGLVTGLVVTAVQLLAVVPLIQQAEVYEQSEATLSSGESDAYEHDHAVGNVVASDGDAGRAIKTGVATVLTAIGYALLLGAFFSRTKSVGWRKGIVWGLAGFAVFQLAPAIGLPPEPPGTPAADITLRQLWWVGTALATALGLGALFYAYTRKRPVWILAAIVVLIMPHLIGAPQPTEGESLVPAALARDFAVAALLTAGLFWVVLGSVAGYLFDRLARRS